MGCGKRKRMQERKQSTEQKAARQNEQSTLGVERVLGKQKNRRKEAGTAHERLNNWNKRMSAA
jgi:hypothetical protein